MQEDRRDYILSLVRYIENRHLVSHPRLMANELNQALKVDCQPDTDVTRYLLALGHPRFLKTWTDKHGIHVLYNGVNCPLETLFPGFSSGLFLKSLKLIQPMVISEPHTAARRLLLCAGMMDAPDIVEKGARLLKIPRHDIIGALCHSATWGPKKPEVSSWMADLLEKEFDEKDPAWREVIGRALRQTQPSMIAALVKLGVNIRPRLRESSAWGSAQWMDRLDNKLSSAHGRMALMGQLPSIRDCLMMESHAPARILGSATHLGPA